MNIQKIVAIVTLVLIIAGAFIPIPQLEAILLILGLYMGLGVGGDTQVRALVSALVLNTLVHTFDAIPSIGHYLVMILSNLGLAAAGLAVMICLRNVYARVTA